LTKHTCDKLLCNIVPCIGENWWQRYISNNRLETYSWKTCLAVLYVYKYLQPLSVDVY